MVPKTKEKKLKKVFFYSFIVEPFLNKHNQSHFTVFFNLITDVFIISHKLSDIILRCHRQKYCGVTLGLFIFVFFLVHKIRYTVYRSIFALCFFRPFT